MPKLRENDPGRSVIKKKKTHYRSYKKELRIDFNKRCGYCDDHDCWAGGRRFYQIDHFVPKKVAEDLEHEYSNLVYSCFYCNNSKKKDWPTKDPNIHNDGKKGYVDPCDPDYGKLFKRDAIGRIIPVKGDLAGYIHRNLKLYLFRHAIIWEIHKVDRNIRDLRELLDNNKTTTKEKELLFQLLSKFHDLFGDLRKENDE